MATTAAGGASAGARPMSVMRPLHPMIVPPVEPEPKEAKLVGPMVSLSPFFLSCKKVLPCFIAGYRLVILVELLEVKVRPGFRMIRLSQL